MKVLLESLKGGLEEEEEEGQEEQYSEPGTPQSTHSSASMSQDGAELPPIPDKSRSLRARSVQKRFQTELKMKGRRRKDGGGNNGRMTKYRRKAANAKERERMKKVNEAFERLREVMPDLSLILQDEKDTKVTTLRAAITYIYGLQNLLEDIHAGNIDPHQYKQQEPQVMSKKALKPTKPVSKPRSQAGCKTLTKQSLKISPVTLAPKVVGGRRCERRAQAKYVFPLRPREEVVPVSSPTSAASVNPVRIEQSPLPPRPSQVLHTYRITQHQQEPVNLMFLEPVPQSDLAPARTPGTLPSMESLRGVTHSDASCEYYVILNSGLDFGPLEDLRLRRDSGGSTGLSLRSLSSSPDSSLSGADMDLDSMECSVGMTSLDCSDGMAGTERSECMAGIDCSENIEKAHEEIPQSPTDIMPTIDQLFKHHPSHHTHHQNHQDHHQQIECMDQFVILEDIQQIIGDTTTSRILEC